MFFRKKKVDYEDDYDDDNWDDLDDLTDEGGFNDSSNKGGVRKAIGTLTGSFIGGVKNSAMSSETHKRIIKRSLPEGFVSHYDDILSVKKETKAIYDTVSKDVKKTHDAYRNELKPHINEYHRNKGGKVSGALDKWANRARDTSSGPSGPSHDELAFLAASEGVFGGGASPQGDMSTTQAQQNIDQAEDNATANKVSAIQGSQANALLTHAGNQLNRLTSFNEQVAMRWKRKTLELQFKQFFIARKNLDVNEQTQGLLKTSLEAIVKNTGLPDAVKVQFSEAAKQVFRDKFLGSIHDTSISKFSDLASGVSKKLLGRVGETLEAARGQSGMINMAAGLINKGGDGDMGQSPMEMVLSMIGGAGGGKAGNWLADKVGNVASNRINESGLDTELLDARTQFAKSSALNIGKGILTNGTGINWLDNILKWGGAEDIITSRSTTLQSSMEDNLRDQAMFDLETKKSITYSIPALLGEIHAELNHFRKLSHPESKDPKRDDKLRMDWKTGKLNTTGNIVKDMKQRLYTPARLKETEDTTRELLEKLGFKKDDYDKDGNLTGSDSDDIILTAADLSELSKALRRASYDSNVIFDPVDIAAARSGLFSNKEAELRIADFFTQQFEMDASQRSLANTTDHIADFRERQMGSSKKSLKAQSILMDGMKNIREKDGAGSLYEKMMRTNSDLMAEDGLVGLNSSNGLTYDVAADTEFLANANKGKKYNARELQRGDFKDPHKVHYRAEETQKAQAEKDARSKKNKEEMDKKGAEELNRIVAAGGDKANAARTRLYELLGQAERDPNYNPYKKLKGADARYTLSTDAAKPYAYGADAKWAGSLTPAQLNERKDSLGTKTEKFLGALIDKATGVYEDITNELKTDVGFKEAMRNLYGDEWQDKQKDSMRDLYTKLRENTQSFTEEQIAQIQKLDLQVIKEFAVAEADKLKLKVEELKASRTSTDTEEVNPADIIRGRGASPAQDTRMRLAAMSNHRSLVPEDNPDVIKAYPPTYYDYRNERNSLNRGVDPLSNSSRTTMRTPSSLRDVIARDRMEDAKNYEAAWSIEQLRAEFKAASRSATPITEVDPYNDIPYARDLAELAAAAGIENKFMGGSIGNYYAGGKISRNGKGSIGELNARMKVKNQQLSGNIDKTSALVKSLINAYNVEKANNGGKEAVLFVGTKDEYVVPNTNNESKIFSNLKETGWWDNYVKQVNDGTVNNPDERITAETSAFNPNNDDVFEAREPYVQKTKATEVDTASSKISEWVKVTKTGFDGLGKQLGAFTDALIYTPEGEEVPDTRIGKLKGIGERTAVVAKNQAGNIKTTVTAQASNAKAQATAALARGKETIVTEDGVEMPEGYELTPANDPNISIGKFRKVVKLERNDKGILVAHYSYINAAVGDPVESKEDEKKKGFIRTGAGLLFKASMWGPTKTYKSTIGRDFRKSVAGKGKAIDVYLIGDPEPVLTVRDMKKGLYLDQKTGEPIKTLSDIKGPVVDTEGNIVISAEDIKEKRLVTREGAPVKGLLATVAGGLFGIAGATIGGSFGLAGKAVGAQVSVAKILFGGGRAKVTKRKDDDFITQDVYVKGENKPRIKAKDVKTEEYINSEGKILARYGDIKGTIYDSDATIVLDIEDYEKGLVYPDGSTIGKVVKAGFGAAGSITAGVFKAAGISAGILPMLASGGLKLAGAAFKGTGKFFGLLTGNGGGMSNSKYTMMLQTQAAAVDKLEMIRLLIDDRMVKPEESKYNDKDKDGYRDGSWYSKMMAKKDEKKKAKEDKKAAKKDENGDEKKPGFLSSMLSSAMGFLTTGPLIAMAGGALIGAVGPSLMKAVSYGIKNILPSWLGGYKNDEERAAGKANIFAKNPQPGAPGSGMPGAPAGPDTVDADGNVVPGAPAGPPLKEGMSLGNRVALGAGGALALRYGGSAAVKGTAKGAWAATKWVGKKVVKPLAKGVGRFALKQVGRIAATHAAGALVTTLASNPVGWAVAAVIAVGLVAYGGYKLYKYLKSRKDNHLTEFRMNQYGYEIGNKDVVTKILDLEEYLKPFTTPGSKSQAAAITGSAQATEAHRIFGIKSDNKEDVARFDAWFFGRFKPIYLSWMTTITRTVGRVDLAKIDEMSFKADKLAMIQAAHYSGANSSPYNVMTSPLAEGESVELDSEAVYSEYKKILTSLKEINAEDHDAKVSSKGGGPKNLDKLRKTEKVKSVTDKPATGREVDSKGLDKNKAAISNKAEESAATAKNKYLFGSGDKPAGIVQAANNWADNVVGTVKGWFGGGAGGPSGEFDASSKTLNLTEQDIMDIAKVTTTEVAMSLSKTERERQAAGVIDTILNRTVTGKWGNNVRGVINAKRQFSKIAGPPSTKPYGSVQNMPTSAMNGEIAAFTREYLAKRAAGQKSIVDGNLSYANPMYSTGNNKGWIADISRQAAATGQKFGTGNNVHVHGTTSDMMKIRPTGYKIKVSGSSSGVTTSAAAPAAANTATSDKPGSKAKTASIAPATLAPTTKANPKGSPAKPGSNGIMGISAKEVLAKPGSKSTTKQPAGSGVLLTKQTTLDTRGPAVGLRNAQKVAAQVDGRPDKSALKDDSSNNSFPTKSLTETSRPVMAARFVRRNALPLNKYSGYCARYVRKGLEAAGYKFTSQAHAYQYATTGQMTSMGFTQINGGSQWQIGDVIIMDKLLPKRKSGHIAIWDGNNWVSDAIQSSFTPYSTHRPPYQLYRDSQYLNGATKGSGWTASVESNTGGADFSNSNALEVGDGGGTGAYGQLLKFKLPDLGITAKTKEDRDAERKNDYKESGRKSAALNKRGTINQYGKSTGSSSTPASKSVSDNIRLGKLDGTSGLGTLSNVPFDITDTNPYQAKDGVVDESRYDTPMPPSTGTTTSYEKGDIPGRGNTDWNATDRGTTSAEVEAMRTDALKQLGKYSGEETPPEWLKDGTPTSINGVQVLTDLSTQTIRRRSDGKILVRKPNGTSVFVDESKLALKDAKAEVKAEVKVGSDKPTTQTTPVLPVDSKADADTKMQELLRVQKEKEITAMKDAETRQDERARSETDRTTILNESLTVQRSMDVTLREIAASLKAMGTINATATPIATAPGIENKPAMSTPQSLGANTRMRTVTAEEPISMRIK